VVKTDTLRVTSHGVQPQVDLSSAPRSGDYSMLFTGCIQVPSDDVYTFELAGGEGALMRIHEATVIDADTTFPDRVQSGAIRLQKGCHPYRIYLRHTGQASQTLTLRWRRGDGPFNNVPATALSHAAGH